MIEILEPGKKSFITTCAKCGCKFSYEIDDIICFSVKCPECGYNTVHDTTI